MICVHILNWFFSVNLVLCQFYYSFSLKKPKKGRKGDTLPFPSCIIRLLEATPELFQLWESYSSGKITVTPVFFIYVLFLSSSTNAESPYANNLAFILMVPLSLFFSTSLPPGYTLMSTLGCSKKIVSSSCLLNSCVQVLVALDHHSLLVSRRQVLFFSLNITDCFSLHWYINMLKLECADKCASIGSESGGR